MEWWLHSRRIGVGAADLLAAAHLGAYGDATLAGDKTDSVFHALRHCHADGPANCLAGLALAGFDIVAGLGRRAVNFVATGHPALVAGLRAGAEVVRPVLHM